MSTNNGNQDADEGGDGVPSEQRALIPPSLKMPDHDNNYQEESAEMPPRTPAERVRVILSGEGNEVVDVEGVDVDLEGHSMFCQMDVLCHFDDGDIAWKEASRWLKYEEKVEAGDRWSKPHVATASLHALTEVRKGLEEHAVVLDLDAPDGCLQSRGQVKDNPLDPNLKVIDLTHPGGWQDCFKGQNGCMRQVAEKIVEGLAANEPLTNQQQSQITDVLTKPHKHKHRDGKKSSTGLSKKDKRALSPKERFGRATSTYPKGIVPTTLGSHKPNKRLMKKIPGGAEAANILVGQVDFLQRPIYAFVRLKNAAMLADLTEVACPTRFLFLVLAPADTSGIWEYAEIGRAVGALMTDKVFSEVAYCAKNKQDILDGIDEFIDDLTVLPPSIWDPSTRLEPPDTTISQDKIRMRLLDSSRHTSGGENFSEDHDDDETLKRTGRIFGGMLNDIKRRYRHYKSDIIDGLNMQCLASIIFLYFACITPIVTFGGLMGSATDGYMGTMESILAGAISGLVYAFFSGQPLTIVGATGPLLVFESILYRFCADMDFDFLAWRWWIGIWITLILLILVATDASALVSYITRFTEESFSVLISIIFIYEAFAKLLKTWKTHPINVGRTRQDPDFVCHCISATKDDVKVGNFSLDDYQSEPKYSFKEVADNSSEFGNTTIIKEIWGIANFTDHDVPLDCLNWNNQFIVSGDCVSYKMCKKAGWLLFGEGCTSHDLTGGYPDVFFLCCFLFLGTFGFAYTLRIFRTSSYFPSIVRNTIADFGVFLSIILMTCIDLAFGIDTPKLFVPSEFKTTRDDRTWVVNPMNINNWWLPLVAVVPAILAVILIFLDQQISAVIVNRKDHKLKKGHGYHLDLFVLSVILCILSILGLPWFVAATVRSITHVKSLVKQSELTAPGEKTQFLGVREQRVTGIGIHILIGVSVLLTPVVKNIPMAVLYGVFLYMGVASLGGVQFVDRIMIMFMPAKYQPDYVYLRHVAIKKVHIFTLIQIISMAIMWAFKSIKQVSLLFPLMILALCFIRKIMEWFFTKSDLYWLDHLLPEVTIRKKDDEKETVNGLEGGMDIYKKPMH